MQQNAHQVVLSLLTWLQTNTSIVNKPPLPKLFVGFSGGVDSTVLLHAMASLFVTEQSLCQRSFSQLCAIHINHQIQSMSNEWETHCFEFCARFNIPFHAVRVEVSNKNGSLEEAARNARLSAFASVLEPNDVLLSAHHLSDQIETMLMRFLRGSSLKGLTSIPSNRPLRLVGMDGHQRQGHIVRPLLNVSKAAILDYAKVHGLAWVEDPSNQSSRIERNFIRNDVFPILKDYYPHLEHKLERTLLHLCESEQLLKDLAKIDFEQVAKYSDLDPFGHSVSISQLLTYSAARQRNCLKYWFELENIASPSPNHFEQILNMMTAQSDKQPLISLKRLHVHHRIEEVILRRYQDYLVLSLDKTPSIHEYQWNTHHPLVLENGAVYHFETCFDKQGLDALGIEKGVLLNVRLRLGGERCKPLGRKTRPLKKILADLKLPPWQRPWVPLAYHQDKLVAVLGHFTCEK